MMTVPGRLKANEAAKAATTIPASHRLLCISIVINFCDRSIQILFAQSILISQSVTTNENPTIAHPISPAVIGAASGLNYTATCTIADPDPGESHSTGDLWRSIFPSIASLAIASDLQCETLLAGVHSAGPAYSSLPTEYGVFMACTIDRLLSHADVVLRNGRLVEMRVIRKGIRRASSSSSLHLTES